MFGLHTVWNQTLTYLLNKEKWTTEKANSEAMRPESEATKPGLEAMKAIVEGNLLIQARLGPIEDDTRHFQGYRALPWRTSRGI